MRLSFVPFASLCLVALLCIPLAAQQPHVANRAEVQRVVDQYMQPFLQKNNIPGAIVGVSIHGQRYFFPYGQATDSGAPFTPTTLVEIGSCTKVFTTTLFGLAIGRNQMSASVSAQQYMPKGYTLQPNGQQATPLMLADFTSGMADDPTNLPKGGLYSHDIEHYTVKDFLSWASKWNPNPPPPASYLYSNAGIGLLSYLIATATGKEWENQLNNEIVGALGMPDTALRPSRGHGYRKAIFATATTRHRGRSSPGMPREDCAQPRPTC
jgi:CubicO group peptidase (beta-lactamase class C family)